jgi:hypothetical protein
VIKLQCTCGQTLNLPDSVVGKQVRCKRCNKVLTIRGSSPDAAVDLSASQRRRLDAELTVQGSRACPGCGVLYPPAVVICVACGLNVDSGAMLYASLDDTKANPFAEGAQPAPGAGKPSVWQRLKRALGLGKDR